MTDQNHNTLAPIVYEGIIIHQKETMLSLTDMWKAAGSDDARRPAEWGRSAEATRFIEFLALTLNMGNSHSLFNVKEGRNGGTWAHWQIAMAYAKYLSPEFHMWCNTVVRERMEGKLVPSHVAVSSLDAEARAVLGGIFKSVGKSMIREAIKDELPAMVAIAIAADPRVAVGEYLSVCELLDAAKVPSKGRNSLNRRVGSALRNIMASEKDCSARRCPRTRTWLFPADIGQSFMKKSGRTMVADHFLQLQEKAEQGILPFRRKPTSRTQPTAGGRHQ